MRTFALCLFFLFASVAVNAQSYRVAGTVTNQQGETIPGVNVVIKGTGTGISTDLNGNFKLAIPDGTHTLIFSGVGFEGTELEVNSSSSTRELKVQLNEQTTKLDGVEIIAESETTRIEKKGFNVDAIETQKIKSQSLEINKVLGRTSGVRVRRSGGMGSDFDYTLDGMSGNAVRFFIDGIPMDYFGSSYSINNMPIALVERIDIYKGVVPAELGSDALGGAINLVTNQSVSNFAEASYSFGSFNTHQATLHGQWRSKSGFTTRLSTFYAYSENNFKVWGRGVYYAEEETARTIYFTEDNPAERFNDDFRTVTAKFDIGFTQKKWADQFFITLLASDQKQGIQTGQTMSHVYGEMRYNEQALMPSMAYSKKDLMLKGLDVNVFAGYTQIKGHTVDTTTNRYDWRGKVIATNPYGGERGRGGSKSIYTLTDKSYITRLNATYQLPLNFKLGFNYLYSGTTRTGADPFAEDYEIPFLLPQKVNSQFAGLWLETVQINERLHANAFLKRFGFTSSINELVYTTEYETIVHKNNIWNWGGGLAASYRLFPKLLIKSSVEQASRLPNATEALGDGINLESNPEIKPEQSFNVNVGTVLGRYDIGDRHGVKIAVNAFYRDVTDRLQLLVQGGQANGHFINIRAIGGTGAEIDMIYDVFHKIKFNINGTYLNIRNTQEKDEDGRDNIIYGDRLRNEPYLMANAGIQYNEIDFIQKNAKIFTYLQAGYVHEFFLNWPSLGSSDNKNTIPSQLVFDAGIGYTFPSEAFTVAFDVSNILNEQVYDNFLLQKPGRGYFFKINYHLNQN